MLLHFHMTTFFTQGVLRIQVTGMNVGVFGVWNFRFWDFVWVGKFRKYFLGWLDLRREFFFAYSKLSDLILHNVIVYLFILFIFSSIYLFYKPFILYYKIEELKMLFVEF